MSNQERKCNTNEQQEWMVHREEEIACLFHFPVVWSWSWKSHLIINTVPVGAAVSSETDLFHHLWLYEKSQDWRKCTSRGHHMSIFILILIFLICTLTPFRNYTKNNRKSFRRNTGVSESMSGGWTCNTCLSKCFVIQQEPNQNYYSFTYLIIQTEFGIISPHVIYLRSKTPEEKITESYIKIYSNLWWFLP